MRDRRGGQGRGTVTQGRRGCHRVERGGRCLLLAKKPSPYCEEVGCPLRAEYQEDGRHLHPCDKRARRYEHRHIGEVRA